LRRHTANPDLLRFLDVTTESLPCLGEDGTSREISDDVSVRVFLVKPGGVLADELRGLVLLAHLREMLVHDLLRDRRSLLLNHRSEGFLGIRQETIREIPPVLLVSQILGQNVGRGTRRSNEVSGFISLDERPPRRVELGRIPPLRLRLLLRLELSLLKESLEFTRMLEIPLTVLRERKSLCRSLTLADKIRDERGVVLISLRDRPVS